MDPVQFQRFIIKPTLDLLPEKYRGSAAGRLLLLTAATESSYGHYVDQYGDVGKPGPAYGPYQMEDDTFGDLWENWLYFRQEDAAAVGKFRATVPSGVRALWHNWAYATVLARLQYWRQPEALPHPDDFQSLGIYYKEYWNTELGKATAAGAAKHLTTLCEMGILIL